MGKHKRSHHESHRRREQFEPARAGRGGISPITVLLALSAVLLVVMVYVMGARGPAGSPGVMTDVAGGGDVTVPVTMLADGAARFYRYTTAAGREVRFFVMKSSDGVVRAAFDACDVCYRERRGYRQRGDVMVCINCRRTFRSVDINVLQGGCNPAPLERTIVGDQVVLAAASIELGAMYF
jgi:uncharacterized membrane protein